MKPNTSWQGVNKWYANITKDQGHYYHQHVVIPGVLRLLQLKENDNVLDLACGAGVLARALPKNVNYVGIDIAKGLIDAAKAQDKNPKHQFVVGDVTKELSAISHQLSANTFSHATCILALQNIDDGKAVLANAFQHLYANGTFIIVLNHPAFRIPRQSSWGIDEANKLQYRKVNRYLTPLKIPITMHPGTKPHPNPPRINREGNSSSPSIPMEGVGGRLFSQGVTWSFHYPLSTYTQWLHETGFVIETMEEWASDKESEGKAARMENRSRAEIPLFLTIKARKFYFPSS